MTLNVLRISNYLTNCLLTAQRHGVKEVHCISLYIMGLYNHYGKYIEDKYGMPIIPHIVSHNDEIAGKQKPINGERNIDKCEMYAP